MKISIKNLINEYQQFMDDIFNDEDEYSEIRDLTNERIKEFQYHPKDKKELQKCINKLRNEKHKNLNVIDVSEITDFSYVFADADMYGIDISLWNVSKGESFSHMFDCAKNFIVKEKKPVPKEDDFELYPGVMYSDIVAEHMYPKFDISMWDVSSGKDFTAMFENCREFNCDLSHWDISSGIFLSNMFYKCHKFNCDISHWDISNAKNSFQMFYECESLKQDLSQWEVNGFHIADMFYGCKKMTNKLLPKRIQDEKKGRKLYNLKYSKL